MYTISFPFLLRSQPLTSSPHVDANLDKLNEVLVRNAAGGGTFFVGTAASTPDFHAWEMCDQVGCCCCHRRRLSQILSSVQPSRLILQIGQPPAQARGPWGVPSAVRCHASPPRPVAFQISHEPSGLLLFLSTRSTLRRTLSSCHSTTRWQYFAGQFLINGFGCFRPNALCCSAPGGGRWSK